MSAVLKWLEGKEGAYVKEVWLLEADQTCIQGPYAYEDDGCSAPSGVFVHSHTSGKGVELHIQFPLLLADSELFLDILVDQGVFEVDVVYL